VPTSAILPSATLAQLGQGSSDLPAEKPNQPTEKHHSVGSMVGLANHMLLFRHLGRLARDVNVVRGGSPRDLSSHADSAPVLAGPFQSAGRRSGIIISLSSQRTQRDFYCQCRSACRWCLRASVCPFAEPGDLCDLKISVGIRKHIMGDPTILYSLLLGGT
jgi:hypothetical protein